MQQYSRSTAKQYNSATVHLYNSATVQEYNSKSVTAQQLKNATVQKCKSATVQQYNSETVQKYSSTTVQPGLRFVCKHSFKKMGGFFCMMFLLWKGTLHCKKIQFSNTFVVAPRWVRPHYQYRSRAWWEGENVARAAHVSPRACYRMGLGDADGVGVCAFKFLHRASWRKSCAVGDSVT